MNDIPLDRIEHFQVDKYYIYSKNEDWINKGIENQNDKVYHFVLEITLRYMKKINNKDIFDCNVILEQNHKKDIFRFKLAFNRINNLVGLFITHDLAVASQISDKIIVMRDGEIIEKANTTSFFKNPKNTYSKSLLDSTHYLKKENKKETNHNDNTLDIKNLRVYFEESKSF